MLLAMVPCPICGRPAAPRADNRSFPFCSPRCKTVDLGKWLSEEYRVSVTDVSGEDMDPQREAGDASSLAQARPQGGEEKA
jgi:endogenous inhibitor of DNA gyrase (YacG/DUF329 family)